MTSARAIQDRHLRDADPAGSPNERPPAVSPRVAGLRDYWSSKCRGRSMPARSDIDPSEIKSLLPYLIISELFDDPVRVRYRLAGARVTESFGFNIAGRWLHELPVIGGHEAWTAIYARAMRTRAPVLGTSEAFLGQNQVFKCPWAVLPLSSDGEHVDQCLEIEDWNRVRPLARFDDADLRWFLRISA